MTLLVDDNSKLLRHAGKSMHAASAFASRPLIYDTARIMQVCASSMPGYVGDYNPSMQYVESWICTYNGVAYRAYVSCGPGRPPLDSSGHVQSPWGQWGAMYWTAGENGSPGGWYSYFPQPGYHDWLVYPGTHPDYGYRCWCLIEKVEYYDGHNGGVTIPSYYYGSHNDRHPVGNFGMTDITDIMPPS